MGLGESEAPFDKRSSIACSICLEIVAGGEKRSTARLICGHEFHLDCIGSAFNAKGLMQCPNCRKIEKGNWSYANGIHSSPDLSVDEWTHDEDLYELAYSEMPYGVHWCPFARLARIPSSLESGSQIGGSFTSSFVPHQYITNSQPHSHIHDHYPHHHYPSGPQGPIYPNARRPGSTTGLPPVPPAPVSLSENTSYYIFQPTPSLSRSQIDITGGGDHFYSQYPPLPLMPVDDRESRWFRPYPHSASVSDSSRRMGLRAEASSYRPPHASRRRPHL